MYHINFCKLLFLVILISCFAVFSESQAAGDTDSLWLKTVQIASENEGWMPGLVRSTVEELNKKGELKSVNQESVIRLYLNSENEIEQEIIKFIEKGENITEKARVEAAEAEHTQHDSSGSGNSHSMSVSLGEKSMFHPDVQDSVKKVRTDRTEIIDGRICAVYEIERTLEDGNIMRGEAYLDMNSGAPLMLKSSPDPLPKHVKMMDTTIYFTYNEGEWHLVKMETDAKASFLFFKKYFKMRIEMSEHWKYEK